MKNCIKKGVFLDELKIFDIKKKEDCPNKENYRLGNLLPHLSKVFERIIYKQIDRFMEKSFHLTYVALEKITMRNTRF